MTENAYEALEQKTPKDTCYHIRKEWCWPVYLLLAWFIGYHVIDYIKQDTWGPYTMNSANKEVWKKLGCKPDEYELSGYTPHGVFPKAVRNRYVEDRRLYLEKPACAAGIYLWAEGSKRRVVVEVYDTVEKKYTATITYDFK
jgi:hypothetical protein